MSFIRENKVNIGQYLPDFLRADPENIATLQVESDEHNLQRILLQDILNQFYVDSADWSLTTYEKILNIVPEAGSNTKQRANNILLKLQGKQTSTLEFMVRLIKHYCSTEATIQIEEDNPHNMFHIINTGGSIIYPNDMIQAVETYKPAHLAYEITLQRVLKLTDTDKICYGLVNARAGIVHIELPAVPEFRTNFYGGVAYARAGKNHINIEQISDFNSRLYVGIYSHKCGKITIGGIK